MASPELIVLSRDRAEAYEPQGREICISIRDPGSAEVTLSPRFAETLRMEFSDIAGPGLGDEIIFAEEHADRIVDLVRRHPEAERIVVHCVGGASRSPAVALGLCDLNGWDGRAIEARKPFWNSLVRKVLAGRKA